MYRLRIKIMSDFLERLKDEKIQLEEKTLALGKFLSSEKTIALSEANTLLLVEQHDLMTRYLNVLIIRIELIEK